MSGNETTRNADLDLFVRSNGTRVYLNREAYDQGYLKLAQGTMAEQCEGCGENIADTGEIVPSGAEVKCTICETHYAINDARRDA